MYCSITCNALRQNKETNEQSVGNDAARLWSLVCDDIMFPPAVSWSTALVLTETAHQAAAAGSFSVVKLHFSFFKHIFFTVLLHKQIQKYCHYPLRRNQAFRIKSNGPTASFEHSNLTVWTALRRNADPAWFKAAPG